MLERETPSDTSAEVSAFIIAGYRRMSGIERLKRMSELTVAVRQLAAVGVRRLHPHATEEELRLELAKRLLPPDLARRAVIG